MKTQTDGVIQFCIDVRPQEMCEWSTERIKRFFAGVAAIVGAVNEGAAEHEEKDGRSRCLHRSVTVTAEGWFCPECGARCYESKPVTAEQEVTNG